MERLTRRANRVIDDENDETILNEVEPNFTVANMVTLAKTDQFPQKYLYFGNEKRNYPAILHFFENQTHFETKPDKKTKLSFICKINGCKLHASIGELTNLNKLLPKHDL